MSRVGALSQSADNLSAYIYCAQIDQVDDRLKQGASFISVFSNVDPVDVDSEESKQSATILTVQDVLDADESFFSGTAAEVVPINSLDGQSIGTGLRGPITEKLQQTYFDQVRGERDLNSPWLTFTN